MPAKLAQHYRDTIVSLYNQGLHSTKIAEVIGKSQPTVAYILKQEVGYSNPRPSQGNINYFEKIDTYAKAYILGFIAADGCISKDKDKNLYSLNIHINPKDESIIYFMKSEIEFETKIQHSSYLDKRTNKEYPHTTISLGNQKLCNDLIKLGISERKTLTLENILINIPKKYRKACILGYFDGDGHVSGRIDKRVTNPLYRTYKIQICGTSTFLQGVADELNLERYSISNYNTWCVLNIHTKKDFYKFYSCYNNLPFYLERKHNVFLQRLNYEWTISSS